MVGDTTNQPPQLAPSLSSSSTTASSTTPEEDEVLKRNTDCVYFLASPLTCKKGSECEYRHSDIARVNPRDCWYWLNGSCLNPKCGFRHPPLDGLLGADVSTPVVGPTVPPPHPAAAPYAMPKQGVACIFFQKGYCLKGHLCPFLHGPPNSLNNNKVTQSLPANPISEPPKMAYSGKDQKVSQSATAQKPVEFLVPQAVRMQPPPPARNGGNGVGDKKAPPPSSSMVVEELPPRYKSGRVVPPAVINEPPVSKPNRSGGYHHGSDNDRVLNGKDADEYSREPSPGFDVLVDNEHGESEYYRNKDEFGRSRGNNDYDLDRPSDYDVDREIYRDYDHYNERQGERYGWDERRSSSERMLVGSAHLERRSYPKSSSPDHFDGSDLRHRISKQRRVSDNGLRSVVSREGGRMPRRDSHHHHRQDHRQDQGGLSSRLRGRIKIPGRSVSPTDGRPPPPSVNHSRLRDRIKDTNNTNNDPRDYNKGFSRIPDNDSKFAGPKRLSELKKGYEQQPNDERILGKRKYPIEEDLSFEGPKPLSEILKSKRGSETTRIKNNPDSHVNNRENNEKERENHRDSHVNKEKERETVAEKAENKSVSSSAIVEPEKAVSSAIVEPEKQRDSSAIDEEDALLDEELEGYEEREGEYEYVDGEEEYNLDEEEGEYVDEELEEYGNENENENENGKKEESVVYL